MFVAEDGDDAAGFFEDLDDFAEEAAFGILDAAGFTFGIVAVLADEQDAIDGELVAALC